MNRKLVRQLKGVGKVYRGQSLLMQPPYAIAVYQEFPGGIPGLEQLVVRLTVEASNTWPLINEELTLELADGSRFEFYFSNTEGDVEYAGGMRDAGGKELW